MNKVLYAMITTNCNLHCPHCEIRTRPDGYNRDKFIEQLNNFDGRATLFGGEPTLYKDRMFDVIKNNTSHNIKCISTNLIKLDDDLIEYYKTLGGLATSWNPNRFSDEQYKTWLHHLDVLAPLGLSCGVLVTLTNDLFDMGPDEFLSIIKDWNPGAIRYIRFEYYVGDTTKEYYDIADNFLCDVYNKWDSPITLDNISIINFGYCYDCSNVFHLTPDGELHRGCPHGYYPKVPTECYSCEMVDKCKPCRLQPYCSYPHKFANLIKSNDANGKESKQCLI